MRSSYFVTWVGITTLIAGSSCNQHQQAATQPAGATSRPVAIQEMSAADRRALDAAVIEAGLIDLLGTTDRDSQTFRNEQESGKLLFSGTCLSQISTLDQELASAQSDKWKDLGRSDLEAAIEAGSMIISRVGNKLYFSYFQPKDRRIALWEDQPASTQPDRSSRIRPRPVHAWPPGYADQYQVAVVVFAFPWSMHSGDATLVLRFNGTNWVVISRHFTYYV